MGLDWDRLMFAVVFSFSALSFFYKYLLHQSLLFFYALLTQGMFFNW